jgi:hypothetical protein
MMLFQPSAIFHHDEDRARQGRTDPEHQYQRAHEHGDRLASDVVDKARDSSRVNESKDQREPKTHRDAHGGVTAQLQQPRPAHQPRWFFVRIGVFLASVRGNASSGFEFLRSPVAVQPRVNLGQRRPSGGIQDRWSIIAWIPKRR